MLSVTADTSGVVTGAHYLRFAAALSLTSVWPSR